MDPQRYSKINTQASRVLHDDHELWVFELEKLLDLKEDLRRATEFNDGLKEHHDTDAVSLVQLAQSGKQAAQQIKLLGVLGMAYVKTALDGKRYIIFKGYAGARPILNGTRYALENPKVSCFVVGGHELIKDGVKATRVAIIAFVAIDIVKEVQADHFCLSRLLVHVASDVLQAVVSTAIGIGVGVAAGAVVVALGAAAAPVVIVYAITVGVGFYASMKLSEWDREYRLTERLVEAATAWEEKMKAQAYSTVSAFDHAIRSVDKTVSDAYQSAIQAYGVTINIYRLWQSLEDVRRLNLVAR